MVSRRVAILLVLASSSVAKAQPARGFPSDSAVRALVQRHFITERRAAGAVVGLLDSTGRRRVFAVGSPGPGRRPLDGTSDFAIASITKTFTGILLASMSLDGSVTLDESVQHLLPATVSVPRGSREISLRDLATHTSGIPRDVPDSTMGLQGGAGMPGPDYTLDHFYAFVSSTRLERDPGTKWAYSNVGGALLGHALAHRAGTSFPVLLNQRILRPLGMEHTGYELTPWMVERAALPWGGADWFPKVLETSVFQPSGALESNADDLLTYLAANIDADRGIRTDSLAAAMVLSHRVHYREERPGEARVLMGLAWWLRVSPSGDTIVWHAGGLPGFNTFIGYIAARKMAVVVLTNTSRSNGANFGFHLLDPGIPRSPRVGLSGSEKLAIAGGAGGVLGLLLVLLGIWRGRNRKTA